MTTSRHRPSTWPASLGTGRISRQPASPGPYASKSSRGSLAKTIYVSQNSPQLLLKICTFLFGTIALTDDTMSQLGMFGKGLGVFETVDLGRQSRSSNEMGL